MEDFLEQKNKEQEQSKNKDKKKILIEKLNTLILILIGFLNIVYANKLTSILPIIIGTMMILTSGITLIYNIWQKEYQSLETMKIPENIVTIILGISILFKGNNAIPFISIIWGISGLRKGTKGLDVALYNKVHKNKFLGELLHAIFEIVISILLIYNPFEKITEHLVLLGIEMIINSIKFIFKDETYKEIDEAL